MHEPDPTVKRPRGRWTSLAVAAVACASAVTLVLPTTLASADPVAPVPPSPTVAPPADPNAPPPPPVLDPNAPPPPPLDPNAPPPPPADPNAPPADPNAPPPPAPPEPGRVDNAAGGFSFVVPPGWVQGDASKLNYGQALLTKETGPAVNGQPAPVATDTSVILGRLDLKLFAGAEPDNAKAAVRLASDMGEFFMPFPGTRVNQQSAPLDAAGMAGSAAYYEVKFTDTTKPNGQIWAGVVGSTPPPGTPRGQRTPERWFVVWLGTAKDPVDTGAAIALANSIRPWSPPPPPPAPAPDPNAPPPDPNAPPPPPGRAPVGVPVPVTTPVPEMMPPG